MSDTFEFGRNWGAFSAAKLDDSRLEEAQRSILELLGTDSLKGRTFLDVGCGSGLFSIAAARCGADRVLGFDLDPEAAEVSRANHERLTSGSRADSAPEFTVGSILDEGFRGALGQFDIVYAWGVLHHTGAMWDAIRHTCSLVKGSDGVLAMAIYNRHWSSPAWHEIKRLHNALPRALQRPYCALFVPAICGAKVAVTAANPLRKQRGMDFWYDVIDWVGGYPYEYASAESVVASVESLGFATSRVVPAQVPTGCNEFVFRRRGLT